MWKCGYDEPQSGQKQIQPTFTTLLQQTHSKQAYVTFGNDKKLSVIVSILIMYCIDIHCFWI